MTKLEKVVEQMEQRFSSGNDVPVSQARITRDEWGTIRNELEDVKEKLQIAYEEIGSLEDDLRLEDY